MSSIILGIAALVAINSFNYNLQQDIDEQAASLLGADLVVSGNRPVNEDLQLRLDSLPAEQASKQEMFSMGYFPKQDVSQFIRLQGLEGDFPFYGELKTAPANISGQLAEGPWAVVDKGFMDQYDVSVGDF